jgi:DNA-binding MarR family transcriptional regulator
MERRVPLGNWFSRIIDAIRAETSAALAPYGVDALGFAALYCMVLTGDGQTQAELTDYLYIDKAATSRLIDALEAAGYVERRPSPTDKRKKLIYLTPAGRALEETVLAVYDDIFQRLTVTVPKKEVLRTLATLETITSNATAMRDARRQA